MKRTLSKIASWGILFFLTACSSSPPLKTLNNKSADSPLSNAIPITFPTDETHFPIDNTTNEEVKHWQKLAAKGNKNAQYNLGVSYYFGEGVAKDDIQAFKWFEKSAKQNVSLAQLSLGIMYYEGHGTMQNFSSAAKWWEKAARAGVGEAQNNLGVMYENGIGVSRDVNRAIELYQQAIQQGVPAQQNLKTICGKIKDKIYHKACQAIYNHRYRW